MSIIKKNVIKKPLMDKEYNKYEQSLTLEKFKLNDLMSNLAKLQNDINLISIKSLSDSELILYHSKLNKIDEIKKQINDIENKKDSMEFYIKNGNILSKYYNSFDSNEYAVNRTDLLSEYLSNNDHHYVKHKEYTKYDEYCYNCGEYRETITSESILICPNCGEEINNIIESDGSTDKDQQQEVIHFEYKRLNHFKDHLARIQAKETTQIPEIVYDIIKVEFNKARMTNLSDLNEHLIKKFLKNYIHLGFNKYYENVYKILYKLTGIPPVIFPIAVEEQLCNMFMKIEEPFENNRPKHRLNLISYPYVLYKLCQLLGYNDYLKYFTLLKSTDKLFEQDKTWKKICISNGWKFYASSRWN